MFFIHSIICVFKEIATPKKAVDVTPVRLSSIDFPLLFGISINPGPLKILIFTSPHTCYVLLYITGFNGTRLSQSGYENVWDYFRGKRDIDGNAQEMTSSGKNTNKKLVRE